MDDREIMASISSARRRGARPAPSGRAAAGPRAARARATARAAGRGRPALGSLAPAARPSPRRRRPRRRPPALGLDRRGLPPVGPAVGRVPRAAPCRAAPTSGARRGAEQRRPPHPSRRHLLAALATATAALTLGCERPSIPSVPRLPLLGPTATPVAPAPRPGPTRSCSGSPPSRRRWPPRPAARAGAAPPTPIGWSPTCSCASSSGSTTRGQPYPDLAEAVPTLEAGGARLVGQGDAAPARDHLPAPPRRALERRPAADRPRRRLHLGAARSTRSSRRRSRPPTATSASRRPTTRRSSSPPSPSARPGPPRPREPNRYGFLRQQRGPVLDPLYLFGLPQSWIYPAHALGPPGRRRAAAARPGRPTC